jgi:hypothetical protein
MKKAFVVVCAVLMLTGVAHANPIQWGGHWYQLVEFDGNWNEARLNAQALGSGWDLATFTSQEEQTNVLNLLNLIANAGTPVEEYWLGGYQNPLDTQNAGNNWTWVTGEEWSWENWGPGEPNDWNNTPGNEQYLAIDDRWEWQWNDNILSGANQVIGYIAENSVPEPSTVILLFIGIIGLIGIRRKIIK